MRVRPWFRFSGLALLAACGRAAPAPEPAPQAQALEPSPPPPQAAPEPAPPAAGDDKPGWSKLSRTDDLPLCAFSDYAQREQAQLLSAAKAPQKLRANEKVVLGVYGPHCLNEACDERPNLQCWVEREGPSVLSVHARFSSLHRDGSSCSEQCMEVDSACETEALAPGKYTVRYGAKTYKLTIPGTLRDPCLSRP